MTETRGRKKKRYDPVNVELDPDTGLPPVPRRFAGDEVAEDEWHRVCQLLKQNNLLGDLYIPTLEMYCFAHTQWVKCADALEAYDDNHLESKHYGDLTQNCRRWMTTKMDYMRALGMNPRDIQKVRQTESTDKSDNVEDYFAGGD